ncbi:RNA-binding domain-containing protein [Dacryopinax primogenitus]|uniref:RNA-binding domain-containing protein n=1 Tax=Dacryopinax primogenitus (strain DJM 731) TaxID=1858805 RepID=M5FWT6_DACPD|nr:RNA-binding domain-containing protein [Dacryopinax primogenitus]EJU00150.1 RNA-binding domain-containing protein [Dacryopinax primogenitus]
MSMMDVDVQPPTQLTAIASPQLADGLATLPMLIPLNGAVVNGNSTLPTEPPCETVYVQNLNESVTMNTLKQTLTNLFKNYGEVLDVVAHHNLRMRGQAFVSFADPEAAAKAVKEVDRFPLYGKPMKLSFAKTRSDAVVQKLDGTHMEEYKAERMERKKRARADNPLRRKAQARLKASAGDGTAPQAGRRIVQMPDEYLPPNKILFLQNLPDSTTLDQLQMLFSQYPGLHEVRLVPTKKDIAFVEYVDENAASTAKDALHNYRLDGEAKMKVTFARK